MVSLGMTTGAHHDPVVWRFGIQRLVVVLVTLRCAMGLNLNNRPAQGSLEQSEAAHFLLTPGRQQQGMSGGTCHTNLLVDLVAVLWVGGQLLWCAPAESADTWWQVCKAARHERQASSVVAVPPCLACGISFRMMSQCAPHAGTPICASASQHVRTESKSLSSTHLQSSRRSHGSCKLRQLTDQATWQVGNSSHHQ
jgi:lysylphosphatidylglycerol synthetase-like protein (DUF2156 family)